MMKPNHSILKSFSLLLAVSFIILYRCVIAYTPLMKQEDCKNMCIDKPNRIYCPTKDLSKGYCCSLVEQCPRDYLYCSNDFPGMLSL